MPPNWTQVEWRKEVAALGDAVALEAVRQYDASRGLTAEAFVMSRVMARLLTRYRQEWSFARRVVPWTADPDCASLLHLGAATLSENLRYNWEANLIEALNQLHAEDRWLVVQIFWYDRNQSDLAQELGISQPAVSKRYRNIVRKLRGFLWGYFKKPQF